jgi:hypothetical protein
MVAKPNRAIIGIISRIFACCLGVAAIVWGCFALPVVWRQSGIEQVAAHIIGDDRFAANALTALIPQLDVAQSDKWDHPSAIRNTAVVRLRILENAIADGDQPTIDTQMTQLNAAIDKSLENEPADPFLWVVRFWLENTQNGYSPEHLKYLRMSYLLGPNEGWVAIKRNRIALAIFSQLPPDLAEDAKGEFVRLFDSRFYDEAADILVGPGWAIRGVLLAGLKDATELNRQLFARSVYHLGYDVTVPGVEPRDKRPWD